MGHNLDDQIDPIPYNSCDVVLAEELRFQRLLDRLGDIYPAGQESPQDLWRGYQEPLWNLKISYKTPGHTLEATALVNELYLKLVGKRSAHWASRNQFFATMATAGFQGGLKSTRRAIGLFEQPLGGLVREAHHLRRPAGHPGNAAYRAMAPLAGLDDGPAVLTQKPGPGWPRSCRRSTVVDLDPRRQLTHGNPGP